MTENLRLICSTIISEILDNGFLFLFYNHYTSPVTLSAEEKEGFLLLMEKLSIKTNNIMDNCILLYLNALPEEEKSFLLENASNAATELLEELKTDFIEDWTRIIESDIDD